mmetsp:Transcript_12206/g.14715  ORF Transcript_12206/g.14715 Transcript_12206/m.14715 type:complete len:147 (-) Transcript_12206:212-652(-)|eukprot:CAMPEP_0195280068 /NCGR_PEP_ID=MMETSP0706-20130129/20854_1 /TAXON_ID=33640 /ORGANISM="Asterionellopsis glacialis, Strain CCMP134" /LENGTH=146 /DNA_ID=CAMNT_0040338717 /DNA_START=197 /DNA_END=637 /DNA_ORIENTATION=+
MNKFLSILFLVAVLACATTVTQAFVTAPTTFRAQTNLYSSSDGAAAADPNEVVGRRIIVTGDVQGGYYRACVNNEAGKFRRLIGTMTPPDDTNEAEIYVEGKRKMVDGFVRWCKKGNVGLSQVTSVKEVIDEVPTGLYDGFYVKTD